MNARELAALYEAAEQIDDTRVVIAVVRALQDPVFAADVLALLRASPETREAFRGLFAARQGSVAANR